MPRTARIVVPDMPYHVTQRGNNRQDVFFTPEDRHRYLDALRENADRFDLRVLGYCLMTNHVHLVVIPRTADALAKAIGRTHWRYSQYVNRMHGRTGHLWQNRFFSCLLDEHHCWEALRYVERNPVRARMVRLPWRYEWSSAAAHIGEKDTAELLDLDTWRRNWKPKAWQKALRERDDEAMVEAVRMQTRTGRPLASDRLIARLEARIGRRLRPLPVGRPKKAKSKKTSKKKGKTEASK
ncbi:MAG: transposase [Phycisphaerales bacterium]|nr:transposase [Phycisphaerales bacterium]